MKARGKTEIVKHGGAETPETGGGNTGNTMGQGGGNTGNRGRKQRKQAERRKKGEMGNDIRWDDLRGRLRRLCGVEKPEKQEKY